MGDVANYIPGGADIGSAVTQGGAQFAGGGGFSPSGFTDFGGGFGPSVGGTAAPLVGGSVPSPETAPVSDATSFINPAQQAALTGGVYTNPITGQIPQGDIPRPPAATSVPASASPINPQDMGPAYLGGTTPLEPPGVDPTNTPNFFKRLADSIGEVKKDYGPLFELGSLGVAGGGLLKQLLQPGGVEALNPLQQEQLNMMRQQQQTAQQYMTGQVTPEMQQNIQNQTQANIQQIKAKYAQMGMSGSTAEAQEIAGAEARGTAQLGQAQSQMIQTGSQMLGLPTQTIAKLSAQQLAQDKDFSDALAAFVGSLAGTPPKKA